MNPSPPHAKGKTLPRSVFTLQRVLPSLAPEQAAIVAYVDEGTAKMQELVCKVDEAMERL